MSPNRSSEDLLSNLLDNTNNLGRCKKWLTNCRLTVHGEDLAHDCIDSLPQNEFVKYLLNFLRDQASKVKNDLLQNANEKSLETNSETKIKETQITEEFNQENKEYLLDFPELSESQRRSVKTIRRIKPTPIPRETDKEKITYKNKNITVLTLPSGHEKRFQKKFSSSSSDSLTFKQPVLSTPETQNSYKINNRNDKKLNIIIELYTYLIINGVVPNISSEIQFILNMFNYISVPEILSSTTVSTDILLNVNDWVYFCIECLIRLDSLLLKMDYLTRKFLHTRLSELRVCQATHYKLFLEKLKIPLYRRSITFTSFVKLYECPLELDETIDLGHLNLVSNRFCEIKKKWGKNDMDNDLLHDLKFLLTIKNDIIQLNYFGKIFVECLIKSLEESRVKDTFDQKLNKVSSRINLAQEHEDHNFSHFELFYKFVMDFMFDNCPEYLLFIKYWLLHVLKSLTSKSYNDFGEMTSVDTQNSIISSLIIKILLAKFLGYIEFFDNKMWDTCAQSEKEKKILGIIRGDINPTVDVKNFILRAVNEGQLTDTVPWVIQYLCMSNRSILLSSYYKNIIFTLLSINLATQFKISDGGLKKVGNPEMKKDQLIKIDILIPNTGVTTASKDFDINSYCVVSKESSLTFIKLWIGKLFNSKILGEEIYFNLFGEYIKMVRVIKPKGYGNMRTSMDSTSIINTEEVFLILCSHFSKMIYWDSSNSYSSLRNVRPILLESTELIPTDDNIDVQVLLENEFLKRNLKMASIIDFVHNHIFAVFQTSFLNKIDQESEIVENNVENLYYEKFTGIMEDCQIRVVNAIKTLTPTDINIKIIEVTISICLKKLKKKINEWLILQGYKEVLIMRMNDFQWQRRELGKDVNYENNGPIKTTMSNKLINFSILIRKLHSDQKVVIDINEVLNDFLLMSNEIHKNKEHSVQKVLYVFSWNFVLEIVTAQPHLLTVELLENISLFWMREKHGDNQRRIICPRLIKASILKGQSDQKVIAHNIGQLFFWVMIRKLLTGDALAAQWVAILQLTWNKEELDFILTSFSAMKDALAALVNSTILINLSNRVCDIVNSIKMKEQNVDKQD